MFLRQVFLFLAGSSAGGVIAAGIFAFLAIIGVFPRLIGATGTARHILMYESFIIAGGVWGNAMDLYHVQLHIGGTPLLAVYGLSFGIFVGCLVMSLAETLKALPVLNRRIRLSVGIQYLILAIALGKFAGAWLFFTKGFGGV